MKHDSMDLYLYAFLTSAITELHGRVIYAISCMGRRDDADRTAVRPISTDYISVSHTELETDRR